MRRLLHIAEPCSERWESMTGDDARKHCARCDKHVIALSALSEDDARALLQHAKPHSLCVRIEHDDDGVVLLRNKHNPPAKPAPSPFRLAVGASLLLAACAKTDPPAPTTTEAPIQKEPETPHAIAETPAPPMPIAPAPPSSAQETPGSNGKRSGHDGHSDAEHGKTKTDPSTGHRVTMGCICLPNDPDCACL